MTTKICIIGANRYEEVEIKPKEFDKRWFDIRGGLYGLPPGQLKRMIVTEDGKPTYDEEVLIYPEDSIKPYDGKKEWFDLDTQLKAIDIPKYADRKTKAYVKPRRDYIGDLERLGGAIVPVAIAAILVWSVVFQ